MTTATGSLNALLDRSGTDVRDVRDLLASIDPGARVRVVTSLDRGMVVRLWDLAADGVGIDLAAVIAPGSPALVPVTYSGQNNLPVLRRFRKVLYRTSDGAVGGYNDSPARRFAGPGYFTVEQAGPSVRINYSDLPRECPEGFPAIRSNAGGVARLVYGDLVDNLRWVDEGTFVGRAQRRGRDLDNYFVIVR